MIPSYPASIVCLRAKHAFRPKYAFGEKIHAGRTCLHSCARRAGVGWGWEGAKKKTGITTKAPCTHLWRHSELPRDTDRPKSANHLAGPFSPALGFGFGTAGVSAQELCSVVLIMVGIMGDFFYVAICLMICLNDGRADD